MATFCKHCERPIHPPKPGSYPPAVEWVHRDAGKMIEPGNRYCSPVTRTTAEPRGSGAARGEEDTHA